MEYTRVYNPAGELQGILENASVQYILKESPLHSAKITLPTDDPSNSICAIGNEIEIYDNGTRVERFRIISSPEASYTAIGGKITYNCEHVLAYLLDDVLFGYHEIGGANYTMTQCIQYILSQQTTVRWRLGTCAFSTKFQYSYENESLLAALLALPKQLTEGYQWTLSTTSKPWTLNLIAADAQPSCEMRYARNMEEIKKSVDASELCTRLYPLGYGEGANQLNIRSVNNGVPYIDADTIGTWGLRARVWADARFEIPASLLNRGKAILKERKNPYISYKVRAVDLYPLTGEPFDRFQVGKIVRVNDQEHGILLEARVVEISKKDVYGNPGEITVTIANKSQSVADTIADLAGRASINELYAQGATNIYQVSFQDNADKDHPAVMKVQIPTECVRINKIRLTWKLSAFRSYSKGAEAGGGTTATTGSGGGTTATSSDGGGKTATTASGGSSTVTSASGGATSVTVEEKVTSHQLAVGAPMNSADGSGMYYTDAPNVEFTGYDGTEATGSSSPYTDYLPTTVSTDASSLTVTNAPSATYATSTDAADGSTGSGGTGTTGSASPYTDYLSTSVTTDASSLTVTNTPSSSYDTATGESSGSTGSAGTGSTGSASGGDTGGASIYVTTYVDGLQGSHRHAMGHTHDAPSHSHSGPSHTHSLNDHTHSLGSHRHGMSHTHSMYHRHTVEAHHHTGSAHSHSLNAHTHGLGDHRHYMSHTHSMYHRHQVGAHTHSGPNHRHSLGAHTHYMRHFHMGVVTITIPALTLNVPSHTHSVSVFGHTHSVTISAHTHTVTLEPHTHNLTIPMHTHDITPGIYDGPSVSGVAIAVDDTAVPASAIQGDELDIIAYLAKDSEGKITRGTWHTITLTPIAVTGNTGGLTRIEAAVFVQTFIRSQGGGDY